MKLAQLLAAAAFLLAPTAPAAAEMTAAQSRQSDFRLPAQLSGDQHQAYRAVFAAMRAQNWGEAAARIESLGRHPLADYARAKLYTDPGTPRVEVGPLLELLSRAPDLPQASDLHRLASARGAVYLPDFRRPARLNALPPQPRRARPRTIRGDAIADQLEPQIQALIVADQPYEAEAILNQRIHDMSEEARTAFRQRIAWSYYLTGNDREARRLAEEGRRGVTEWAIHADWVAGLAAWRMGDCAAAADHFGRVGTQSGDQELMAAGQYWAARADMRCGRPERVQARLRTAARLDETFYGLLSQSALGVRQPPAQDGELNREEWRLLESEPNVRAALALHEIGEETLAGELLRHQARLGGPRQHEPLVHLAAHLNLTATQMWLAHNGPSGAVANPLHRYPSPGWRPARGWRVEEALAFAHALQESNFRADAVSPAGARGLMQVRPGTAGDLVRWGRASADPSQLNLPSNNLEFGQAYLEYLRDQASTGGLLPKVIASYNAGPAPMTQWNARYDQSDPLLFIESIPYWETRGYVPIVLRNYWMYERRTADASPSRRALVQGLWPRFPGMSGASAVRIPPRSGHTAQGQR